MSGTQVNVIEAIVAQYEADLKKAERDLERAKKKVEQARMQLTVGRDMLDKVREGVAPAAPSKSLGDLVLKIVNESKDGLTAKGIHALLDSNVEIAAVHVAADRLADNGKIQRDKTSDGKLYRRVQPLMEEDIDNF